MVPNVYLFILPPAWYAEHDVLPYLFVQLCPLPVSCALPAALLLEWCEEQKSLDAV